MTFRRWVVTLGVIAAVLHPAVVRSGDDEDERRKREEEAAKKALKEEKQAQEIADEIQEQVDQLALTVGANLYSDSFLQDYVNEMGQSLVPVETPPGVLFSFRVVNDPTPNAMALPDGRIYVNTGLLIFVENEAQLATVLGHEIGHVIEKHTIEAIRDSRSFKKRVLPGILGVAAGAAIGAVAGGKDDAAKGAAIGAAAGAAVTAVALNSYSRRQEDEADRVGARLALGRGFDAAAGSALFEKLAGTFGDQDRFSNLLWGKHSRNVERAAHIRTLLAGEIAPLYNERRTAGALSLGSGQMQLYTSRMLRDVAIAYMEHYDRYDIAKRLLEGIADYRASDPKTLWALGRLYKMVGRTESDKSRAIDHLQRAASLDARNMYPYIHRDLGLMRARLGPANMPAAIDSLKKYVLGHIERYGGYPPDLEEMYDYLLLFGDNRWTAPRMENQVIRAAEPRASQPRVVPEGAAPPAKALKTSGGAK